MPKIEETTAFLEATIEASNDGILVLGVANVVIFFNQAFLHMFGLSAADVADKPCDEVLALLSRASRPGLPDDHFTAINGLSVKRCSVPVSLPDTVSTGEAGHLEIFRDVSEWRGLPPTVNWERALLDRSQRATDSGSWTWDGGEDAGALRCSGDACRILGVVPEECPDSYEAFLALVYTDDRDAVRRAVAAALASGDTHEVEHRIVQNDGQPHWLCVKARVTRDEHGTALRMAGTIQDTTRRRALEEQLRQSQKVEVIGRLAGGVAHDLNNVLTAIVGYTELALNALARSHPAWADVDEIRRAAERAESVTRQLLAFSRKQRLQARVFDLGKSIESLSRTLKRLLGGDIELTTVIDDGLPPIYGDPGQIQQALINLAINARDAMGPGGRLSIRIGLTRTDDVFAQTHPPMPPGEYVELSVSDTGAGMTLDTQAHIFEPFFTTKDVGKGTGLGLPMVYGTVKQSGGFVFVDSAPGRGSTFRVYFPPAVEQASASPVAPAQRAPRPATILIAEDEAAVRTLVIAALSSEGYQLLQAESGAAALKLSAGQENPIDLLLTDANMPGMNGVELATEMLHRHRKLQVVIMSGYITEAPPVSGLEQPIAFLPKPFTLRALRQTIRDVLARTDGRELEIRN